MVTNATKRNRSMKRPRTAIVLSTLALIAATLMPGGAGAQPANAAPLHQEEPTTRLPYDGVLDLPHLETNTVPPEVKAAELGPEYTNWSKLAFQSYRNTHDWEVFGARGDGSNQANLSNNGSTDMHPRLNRGATRVAFSSRRDGNYEIYVMNVDGSGQTRLTNNGADDVYPAWSPDGSKIAFQSYRDGQPEIYVMDANGSGQTRITNYADYDGQPAWSPDSSKIAFVRRLSGQYRVWVMNADGSNPQQRSGQALSQGPVWSPDGTKIAYDSDGDGDGWQEIWLMDAGGGNQSQVYQPGEGNTDTWVRSWSPDGRYVAFSRITWTYYQGQWYWTTAYLDAWDSTAPWNTIRLSNTGYDWHPGWETTDAQAPTSRVQTLPAQSPGPFTVRWTGADTGGSGFKNYDIQVKDGPNGAWSNWKTDTSDTSASYPGIGGHTYYFRSRARDNAGNLEAWPAGHDAVTTVEALAPQTSASPLPRYSRAPVLVQWGGIDPGGSGIESYDVQYRQGDGSWNYWYEGTTETSAAFDGVAGIEYRFQVRARDKADNLEDWPTAADATTVLHTWAIAGRAVDNRGTPVTGMTITTTPAPFHSTASDMDGTYAAHVAIGVSSYAANWSKPSYGALPQTAFPPDRDADVNVVLPPADNAVQNWGFEEGNSGWQFGGTRPSTITQADRHTGTSSAFLGYAAFSGSQYLLQAPHDARRPTLSVDPTGAVHVAWDDYGNNPIADVFYAHRSGDGTWSPPRNLTHSGNSFYGGVSLATENDGTAHLVWYGGLENSVFYARRANDGSWSGTQNIGRGIYPDVAVDSSGVVHMLWYHDHAIRTAWRSPAGVWTTPQVVAMQLPDETSSWLLAGPAGELHAFWRSAYENHSNIYAVVRDTNGVWSAPEPLLSSAMAYLEMDRPQVDSSGRVHVLMWGRDRTGPGLYYGKRSSGVWQVVQVPTTGVVSRANLAVEVSGSVHLLWNEYAPRLFYRKASSSGIWSATENLVNAATSGILADGSPTYLALNSQGLPYAAWGSGQSGGEIYITWREFDGTWIAPLNASQAGYSRANQPLLAVDNQDVVHLIYVYGDSRNLDLKYINSSSPADEESLLTQTLTVPDTAAAETLSLLAQVYSAAGTSSDELDVRVNGTPLQLTVGLQGVWKHYWSDLSPWANQQVTLSVVVHQQAGRPSVWAYVDEISVGSAHPDIWVGLSGRPASLPSGTFDLAVAYGNRGGVAASNGQVTLQLPAELSFVSADPPPSATAPLRWDVDDLPEQSSNEIHVALQMADTAPFGATLTTSAGITSDTAEIELANNTATGTVFVGSLRYMPLIVRH